MGVRAASAYSTTFASAFTGGTTEVMVFTLGPLILAADNATVVLAYMLLTTSGTSQNSSTLTLRRGTTTSSPPVGVGPWSALCAASSIQLQNGWYADQPGVALASYCLTAHQNAGSGAATFADGCLLAFVL